MEILSGEEMRNVDRRAIVQFGIPGLDLMEAAGRGVAESLLAEFRESLAGGVLVVCGKGNNGGDGFVIARHLAPAEVAVRVLLLCDPDDLRGDAAVNYERAREAGIQVGIACDEQRFDKCEAWFDECSLIVDAVLGTGVRGGARGLAARAIERMNDAAPSVVAVDVPSGLNADSHAVEGAAVRARHTLTLCRPKRCLLLEPAARHVGSWSVIDIGIPDEAVAAEHASLEWLDAASARALLPSRDVDSHKGSYGHVLAVAGGRGKSGAAVLLGRAALRAGVGLLTVATPRSCADLVAVQQAELMTEALPETARGNLSRRAANAILELASDRDVLAIGPGLGTDPGTRAAVHTVVKRRRVPAVVDADALNAFARGSRNSTSSSPALAAGRHPLVLTPHPGEAARLLGYSTRRVQTDRLAAVRLLARRTGAVTVLKGHRTLIACPQGRCAINASGNPGMATAGSGDVLTGIVAAFLARGISGWDAARLAVWVHGAAGDRAARKTGFDGLIATSLIRALPRVLRDLARAPTGETP